MTPAWTAMLALGLVCAAVSLTCFGWVLARWVAERRGPDAFEQRARRHLIDALTDPKPQRWSE